MHISIRNTVREIRAAWSMTQTQLAELVGITRQTIGAVEANRHSKSLAVAFRIARTLGLPVERVFTKKRV